jgi:hypothetical protein
MPLSVIDSTGLASPLTGLNNPTVVGNMTLASSGGGIVFNPTSQGSGHTSNTMTDYEEGTWTPIDASGAGLTFTGIHASYVKVGKLVTVIYNFSFPSTANSNNTSIGGLPFTITDLLNPVNIMFNSSTSTVMVEYGPGNGTAIYFYTTPSPFTHVTNAALSTIQIYGTLTYIATT